MENTRRRILVVNDDDDDDDDDENDDDDEHGSGAELRSAQNDDSDADGRSGFVANTYAADEWADATDDDLANDDIDDDDVDEDDIYEDSSDALDDSDDDSDDDGRVEARRLQRAFKRVGFARDSDDSGDEDAMPPAPKAETKHIVTQRRKQEAWAKRASNYREDLDRAFGVHERDVDVKDCRQVKRIATRVFRARATMNGGASAAVKETSWGLAVKYDEESGMLCLPCPGMPTNGLWACVLCVYSADTTVNPLLKIEGDVSSLRRHCTRCHADAYAALQSLDAADWKERQSEVRVPKALTRAGRANQAFLERLQKTPVEPCKEKRKRSLWSAVGKMSVNGDPIASLTNGITQTHLSYWLATNCVYRLQRFTHKVVTNVRKAFELISIRSVRRELARAEFIALSFDLWMGAGTDVFALMASFADRFGKPVSRVLAVVKSRTLTSAEMTASIIKAMNEHPELKGKITGLVSDQGANVQAVQDALLKAGEDAFHPMMLTIQLLCAAHRFATAMRRAMDALKGLNLYPDEGSSAACGWAPRAKSSANAKGRTGHNATVFGAEVWTFHDIMVKVVRACNFMKKSATARREYESVANMFKGEGEEYSVEFQDALARPPKSIPKTRFNFTTKLIAETLRNRPKLQAAQELESTATNRSRKKAWQEADTLTSPAYLVLEHMHKALELLGRHTAVCQSTSHYTFCDVGIVVLTQIAASTKAYVDSGEVLESLEDEPSSQQSPTELWIRRASAKATHVLNGKLKTELEAEFHGLAKYTSASVIHEVRSALNVAPPDDDVSRCMLASFFFHPAMWACDDLYKVVSTDDDAFRDEGIARPSHITPKMEFFMYYVFNDIVLPDVVKATQAMERAAAAAAPIDDAVAIACAVSRDIELGENACMLWGSEQTTEPKESDAEALIKAIKVEAKAYRTMLSTTQAMLDVFAPSATKVNELAKETIIAYWTREDVRSKCPLLSKYARFLFSVPQTQCDCERLFSMFGRLTAGPRANTSLESLQCSARMCFNLSPDDVLDIGFNAGKFEFDDDDAGSDRHDPSHDVRRAAAIEKRAERNLISQRRTSELLRADVAVVIERQSASDSAAAEAEKRRASCVDEPNAEPVDGGNRRRRKNGTTPKSSARTQRKTPSE